jgi:sucrose-6-phosphate hydrolase SacC (GH32 family)
MPDQQTLGQAPAPELQALRVARSVARADMKLSPEPARLAQGERAYELFVEFEAASLGTGQLIIDVLASDDSSEFTRLLFDPTLSRVTVDKSKSTLSNEGEGPQVLAGSYDTKAFGPMRSVRVIVDASAIEVFVNDAAAYAVRSYPSRAESNEVRIGATGASAVPAAVQLWPLVRPPG